MYYVRVVKHTERKVFAKLRVHSNQKLLKCFSFVFAMSLAHEGWSSMVLGELPIRKPLANVVSSNEAQQLDNSTLNSFSDLANVTSKID